MVAALLGAPPLPHSLVAQTEFAVFLCISAFALWRGDRWQRLVAVVLIAATVLTPIFQDRVQWKDPGARLLLIDIVLLTILTSLAVVVGRGWMIACAAFQLCSTFCHPAAHLLRAIGPNAYLAMVNLFSSGVCWSLAVGVALRRRADPPSE